MKRLLSILAVLLAVTTVTAQQKTYFVSPDGNDAADGLSVATAWKSLEKVNSVEFQPGDKILFESGKTWYGQLYMKGSGSEGQPITISSYGGKCRPVINIGRAEGAGIRIHNQSWWTVENMEVTSGAAPELGIGRQGIVITASEAGKDFSHFIVRNCYIHDIWGQMGGNTEYVGYYSCGILVRVMRDRERQRQPGYTPPTMNDVLIEGNRIERFDKCGIISWGPRNNVVVRKNYMDNLGGDGLFVNGPYRGLIEFNEIRRSCMRSGYLDLPGGENWWPHTAACWIQNTEETIMQFNEVYDTGREPKNGDGFAYDFDFNCKRCIAQYNYSKNNNGFMLLMYNIFENVSRYNISENDRTHLIQMQGSLTKDKNVFYNNVFYVDYGTSDLDYFRGSPENSIDDIGALFYNNIFYATGQGRFRTVYTDGDPMVRNFDEVSKPNIPAGSIFLHNCFFGPWKNGLPDDPEALVADPKFVAPGTGGSGLNTLEGYHLRADSPCINTGMYVPLNGGRDFFGNPVNDGHPDFGAFEYLGSGVFADEAAEAQKDKDATDASTVAWTRWMFPAEIYVDSPEDVKIALREAIDSQVTGTVTYTNHKNSKPVTVSLDKLKDRSLIALDKLNADKETLLKSKISVKIQRGRFTEAWEIPFAERPARRR